MPDGWRLDGKAVFRDGESVTRLEYRIDCDSRWRTLDGLVAGRRGTEDVRFAVRRGIGGEWLFNETPIPDLADCVDLDLGFTPATNTVQIRRLGLGEGQSADVPAAWLDVSTGTLSRLDQRYERRRAATYWYEAPRFDYRGLLQVDTVGFVVLYPGLWEAVGRP